MARLSRQVKGFGSASESSPKATWVLQPDDAGAPGEPAAHRLEQQKVALLDPSVVDALGPSERIRGGRGIGVLADRLEHHVLVDAQPVGDAGQDTLVGLVRIYPVDVLNRDSGMGGGGHHGLGDVYH